MTFGKMKCEVLFFREWIIISLNCPTHCFFSELIYLLEVMSTHNFLQTRLKAKLVFIAYQTNLSNLSLNFMMSSKNHLKKTSFQNSSICCLHKQKSTIDLMLPHYIRFFSLTYSYVKLVEFCHRGMGCISLFKRFILVHVPGIITLFWKCDPMCTPESTMEVKEGHLISSSITFQHIF